MVCNSNISYPPRHQQVVQALSSQIDPKGCVLVVGDVAIDEMTYGVTERMSREAPVLILRHDRTDVLLGAAGNAAHNVAALNAKQVVVVGTLGQDDYAPKLREALQKARVNDHGLVEDSDRPTTTKTRISGIANHSVTQQMVRIDRQSTQPISGAVEQQVLGQLAQWIPQVDAVLLSDYGLGVVTPAVIEQCRTLTQQHHVPFCVDSHQDLTLFQGATVLTPNQTEAEAQLGYGLSDRQARLKGGQELLASTQATHILLTLGGDGMMLFSRGDAMANLTSASEPDSETEMNENSVVVTTIPAFNRSDVFDVTGAGDTVVGTFTLALANGVEPGLAAVLGNLAASVVVRRYGTAVTNVPELMEWLDGMDDSHFSHIQREVVEVSSVPLSASIL